MASPPAIPRLWALDVLWGAPVDRRGRGRCWYLGPEAPTTAQVFDVALALGDAWFGVSAFGLRQFAPVTTRPEVVATDWYGGHAPVLATSDGWAGLFEPGAGVPSLSVVIELELDRSAVGALPGRRQPRGRIYVPWFRDSLLADQWGKQLSQSAVEGQTEAAGRLLAQAGVVTDGAGWRWQWVVPCRRVDPTYGVEWSVLPVAAARCSPNVGSLRRREGTLVIPG